MENKLLHAILFWANLLACTVLTALLGLVVGKFIITHSPVRFQLQLAVGTGFINAMISGGLFLTMLRLMGD